MKIIKLVSILTFVLILVSCRAAPKIDDGVIISEIQDYYSNKLQIQVDLTDFGMGIVPLPASTFFQVSDIAIVDKSISGNGAVVIVRLKFNVNEDIAPESGNGVALKKYFGTLTLERTFVQERGFNFLKYESGNWRLDKELDKN